MKVISLDTRTGSQHFRCPSDGGYLWTRAEASREWRQCASMGFVGKTLTARPDNIEQVARAWLHRTISHPFDREAYLAEQAVDDWSDDASYGDDNA